MPYREACLLLRLKLVQGLLRVVSSLLHTNRFVSEEKPEPTWGLPIGVPQVVLSPKAEQMRTRPVEHREETIVEAPPVGSLAWRMSQYNLTRNK